jgi:HD-GYP domain-containing protein (c-di-GMP phosphodiesterase class II)
MRLPEQQVEDVRAAALLHDIGKLEISRDILYKAARLDEDETEEMKSHVDKGIRILNPVGGSLRRVLPIVLAHHDKFDGSGYHPSRGEEIPVEARIITVADAFDAMISDRPYRKGMTQIEARDAILKGVGSDFDPSVVKAFVSAFRKQRLEIPEVLV